MWLVVASLEFGYLYLARRWRPEGETLRRSQVVLWTLGVLTIWASAEWPMHDLAEGYLYSAHMLQHTLLSLVAPPLLLAGTPAWMARRLLSPPWLMRFVQSATRPVKALLIFNVFIVITHAPGMVTWSVRSELGHFLLHAVLMVTATIMWFRVLSPLPEVSRLQPLTAMFYLFLQSVVPTVPASFLTLASAPLYRVYEEMPKLFGMDALEDQLMAGLIMKLGGATILWAFIAWIFFKWAYSEERQNRAGWKDDDDVLTWEQVKAELDALPSTPTGT